MPATLRHRSSKKNVIELAKNLDAFKKVPEKYTETTEIGGTLSLFSRMLIVYLIYKEVRYYQAANVVYQFEPDINMDDKVEMHVDITVAMPCKSLSPVDVLDETQQDVLDYGQLKSEGTWWKMKSDEREQFERMQHMRAYLREEYHSVADIMFKDIINSRDDHEEAPKARHEKLLDEHDACRLHGTLGINKVAGVLHLVGGSMPVADIIGGHLLIAFRRMPANFSHRINRLSFGRYSRRIIQPLEGDETILPEEGTSVQYFLSIVPTEIHNTFSTINTYQYSVASNVRTLNSEHNSYGSPGIYFKYDWSALKIVVRADRDNIVQFLIRLCSIIAGIIVISGVLNSLLVALKNICGGKKQPDSDVQKLLKHEGSTVSTTPLIAPSSPSKATAAAKPAVVVQNDLISLANELTTQNVLLPVSERQQ